MKQMMTVLSLVVAAAAVLFWKQVIAIFIGMTVLEAMEFIMTFILHVAVGTVAAYVVFGLPVIVKPWVRMFQRKQRAALRGRRRVVTQENITAPKQRRLTVNDLLSILTPNSKMKNAPIQPVEEVELKI